MRTFRTLIVVMAVIALGLSLQVAPASAGSSFGNDDCSRHYNLTREKSNGDFYYYASTVKNRNKNQWNQFCSFEVWVSIQAIGSTNNRGLGGDGAHTGPWSGNAVTSLCAVQTKASNIGRYGRAATSYTGHIVGPVSSHSGHAVSPSGGTHFAEGTCYYHWV